MTAGSEQVPEPKVGQIWRGMNPRLGFGHFQEAEIVSVGSESDPRIILKFKGAQEHGTLASMLNARNQWFFVSHGEHS